MHISGNVEVDSGLVERASYAIYAIGQAADYYLTPNGNWRVCGYEAFCEPATFSPSQAAALVPVCTKKTKLPIQVRIVSLAAPRSCALFPQLVA